MVLMLFLFFFILISIPSISNGTSTFEYDTTNNDIVSVPQSCSGLDGGQYLTGGGTFSQLDALSDDDWNNMRELIRSANNKDKADRS